MGAGLGLFKGPLLALLEFYGLPVREAAIKHAENGGQAEVLSHVNEILGVHPTVAELVLIGNLAGMDCP